MGCATSPTGRNGLDEAAMHLGECLELVPEDASVKKYLKQVQQMQAKLAARGAPPASQAVPEPQPAAFAPGVVFTRGASWMANVVALQIPLRRRRGGGEAELPVFLPKQVQQYVRAAQVRLNSSRPFLPPTLHAAYLHVPWPSLLCTAPRPADQESGHVFASYCTLSVSYPDCFQS